MNSDWDEIELGDKVDILSSKRIFAKDYVEEGVPFYRSKEIIHKALGVFEGDELFITKERFLEIKEKFGAPTRGDMLLSAVGNRSGIPYTIKEDYDFYFKDGNLIWFRNFSKDLDSNYLEYFLKSKIGKHKLNALMIGSAQKALTIVGVKKLRVNLPTLQEQKAIAHILGTLDDKIELNRKMNETLEEMAQAMFKSWFVDFDPVMDNALASGNEIPEGLQAKAKKRKAVLESSEYKKLPQDIMDLFPSSFVWNDELGKWIPEGWEYLESNKVADVTIGKTPPRKETHWFDDQKYDQNYVWVSIKNMGGAGVFIDDSDEYLTKESVEKFNVKVVPENTVLLSFKLTVGRVAISVSEMCTNEAIAHFTNLKEGLTSEFMYFYMKQFDFDNLGSTSSIATAVNSKIIKGMPILVPNRHILKEYSLKSRLILDKIKRVQVENNNLISLRDTLLPKLISGQVRVKGLETV